jgi:isopenicillin N synthase-like dioxygenase
MENTINIPTLDLSVNDNSILSKQFYNACTETGFFFLKNHGISKAQIEELFAESKRFFTQPVEFKETVTAK